MENKVNNLCFQHGTEKTSIHRDTEEEQQSGVSGKGFVLTESSQNHD